MNLYLESILHNLPQLFAQNIAGIFDLQVPPLCHNLLSSEWSLCESPSRIFPPLFDRIDVGLVKLVFVV